MSKAGWAYTVVLIGLIVTCVIALMCGVTFYTPTQIWQAFSGQRPAILNNILTFRLSRIIASMVGGGVLAVAGALSQSVFRNRLADPTILGVTSAGDLFILLGGFVLPALPFEKLVLALLGGAVALALLTNRRTLSQPYMLIIVGVALNLTFQGFNTLFTQGISVTSDTSLNGITWSSTLMLLLVGCVGLILALILSPWANNLKLSDEQLMTVGIPVKTMRVGLLALVVFLSATVTSVLGTIPFVGIIVPNVARKLVGHDYQTLIPFSLLSGAWLLLICDTVGRLIILPSELPVATLMTVIGGPFLIWLVLKGGLGRGTETR
ncbi:FecCD family ABC transporter permease [Secundilactobacillus paracollinoides]|uniref:FecCD family ABC transporter permease n=2 Tax=Secundilactobacillus paracollinoides TaxID=240427 RepID=UPI000AC49086|nr:iron ABC transporter permease [Secundilactobacillus paracollinoides]